MAEQLWDFLFAQGSALNALKRVLLSFGNKIERELQQQQKQINPEQAKNVQKSAVQLSDKQIPEKSNVIVKVPSSCMQTVSVLQTKHENESEPNKNSDLKTGLCGINIFNKYI